MKTPLLLLPGLMCDEAVWAPQLQALGDVADVTVLDWGLRDSITAMAQHTLDSAPSGRFALAGHSMGGRVAFEVLRLAPERVSRVALLDTGVQPLASGEAGEKERAGRMALLHTARTQGMRAMGAQWAAGMVHPDQHQTPLFEAILQMIERSSPAQFAAQIQALLQRPDAAAVLATVRCPALVLCGREDLWSPPAQHEALARGMACAELVVLEHCGHMATLEQAEAVNQALRRWLLA